MRTDDLVAALTSQAVPRRILSPAAGVVGWFAVSLGSAAVGAWWLGPRTDLALRLTSPRYVLEGTLLLALVIGAGAISILLAFPGRFRGAMVVPALATLIGAWMGALVGFAFLDAVRGSLPPPGWGTDCSLAIAMVAAVPILALVVLARRAAPTSPSLNALAIGVAAFASGALSLHFCCAVDGSLHRLAWHALPLVAAAGLSAFLGWRLLRW